ncbi:MAG: exodeoxyribonuclease VII large subunit [Rubellimicrobium sp.]|nr:exodeoxyribonuclease VII large subunit [Rubellimicrobium sp.]
MDLIDDAPDPGPDAGDNNPAFTVSEIAGAVKRVIEGEFGRVRIRGEIGRVSRPASGHLYFNLKDDRASLDAVVWRGQAARLSVRPEEGLEVVATGRLTTFPGASKYQLVVEDMAPAGAGALMAMLEARRKALAAEGLFDAARKRPVPYLPEVIGVITSPSGAVIRDILHRLRDRFPRRVVVWPVAVQGQACAPEVARAIAGFNALPAGGPVPRPDVLIVARGGGSLEDLWGFNEEIVVRAAAASTIPLISAVGHETDTTLIDHAADLRAPTPTAAAELAVPVRAELLAQVAGLGGRLTTGAAQGVQRRRQRLADLSRALPRPERLIEGAVQRLDQVAARLAVALRGGQQARRLRLARLVLQPAALRQRLRGEGRTLQGLAARLAPALARRVAERRARVDSLARVLGSLSYTGTLARGFAVVRAGERIVTRAAYAAPLMEVEFADGRVTVQAGPPPRRPRRDEAPPEQGSLL